MTFHLLSPQPCPIWGTVADIRPLAPPLWYWYDSPRAGGEYAICKQAEAELSHVSDEVKAVLTTILVDKRRLGEMPHVTPELLDEAKAKQPLLVYERAERLLGDLVSRPHKVGEFISALFDDERALAVSESVKYTEVRWFLTYLEECNWVKIYGNDEIRINVDGYARVQRQITNQDSSQAFIAMWVDTDSKEIHDLGIRPAIESAGYKPYCVNENIDETLDPGTLDAIIIGQIRRSRFLVADFTHGAEGIRGSVYFEAGFAYGFGIPVIYTCRKDQIGKLQFDVRQYPYIAWETHDELRDGLEQRILKWIGEGPHVGQQ